MMSIKEKFMEEDTALTPIEVADRLKIAKNTVYELIKRGELEGYKVGKKVRVDLKAVEAYKNRGRAPGHSPFPPQSGTLPDTIPQWDQSTGVKPFVISGQDMMLDILARFLEHHPRGARALRTYEGSYNGLYALYQGQVSIASVHLIDLKTGEYNIPFVKTLVPGTPAVIIRMASRQIGFYVKKGNPKNFQGWEDLKKAGLSLINRERGSGMRILLDQQLQKLGISTLAVNGYPREVSSHLAVASAIARGSADVGIGNEKTGLQVQGVDFIPLLMEKYDLVIKKEDLALPPFQATLEIIRSEAFRMELEGLGGYDLGELGSIVAET